MADLSENLRNADDATFIGVSHDRANSVSLCGIHVSTLSPEEAAAAIISLPRTKQHNLVVTPNVDFYVRWWRDKKFREICSSSSFLVIDGKPLAILASLLTRRPVQRVTGVDLLSLLCGRAALNQCTISIVGGQPGVGERAIAELQRKHGVFPVGVIKSPTKNELASQDYLRSLGEEISQFPNSIVAMCLGSPKQELIATELFQALPTGASATLIGLGASADFYAGEVSRAPAFVQKLGAEWLYRLAQEPRRLAKRYAYDALYFPYYCLREILLHLRSEAGSR